MVTARTAAAALLPIFFSACGYVGDPLPPLANIPSRVTDLAAVQRGGRIIVQFAIPKRTTENFLIKDELTLDLRAGTSPSATFDANQWAAQAHRIPQSALPYSIPAAEWAGKEIAIAVNVIGLNGKASGWSNFANVPVVPEPPRPDAVRAVATASGVRLQWDGPPGDFRVFRRTAEETEPARLADIAANTWTDASAAYGKLYRYVVLRIVKLDERREAESELSDEAEITPVDTFAPTVPTDVRAAAGPDSIELSWERSPEPDVAGYRIYRAVASGDWEKLADGGPIPTYSDRKAERGKSYRYAVSAVDQLGNESARSAAVEAALP